MNALKLRLLALVILGAGITLNLWAVDGVVLIDQNRALAGGVTPGDAPGFPVSITQSGSYRLTGNLTVPDENTTAILISTDNVSIDLNGFSVIGPTACTNIPVTCSPRGSGVGVYGAPHHENALISSRDIRVVNGGIRGMGGEGIVIFSGVVKDVQASSNGAGGIIVTSRGIVSGSTADFNFGDGVAISSGTASGNTVTFNKYAGINANCPSAIVSNTANGNAGGNLVTSGAGCTLANNSAP